MRPLLFCHQKEDAGIGWSSKEVDGGMHCKAERVREVRYPTKGRSALRIAGAVLIALGIVLIVLCVPLWAWMALVGAALILVGLLLIRS